MKRWFPIHRRNFRRTLLLSILIASGTTLIGNPTPQVTRAPLTTVRLIPPYSSEPVDLVGSSWYRTRASWTNVRPRYCYDRATSTRPARRTLVPNISMWTAHKTIRCGTKLDVRRNGRTIVVAVWDRGPYVTGRALDLSKYAFSRLAPTSAGVITVYWRVR